MSQNVDFHAQALAKFSSFKLQNPIMQLNFQ
jgi:hypothetical protein